MEKFGDFGGYENYEVNSEPEEKLGEKTIRAIQEGVPDDIEDLDEEHKETAQKPQQMPPTKDKPLSQRGISSMRGE